MGDKDIKPICYADDAVLTLGNEDNLQIRLQIRTKGKKF